MWKIKLHLQGGMTHELNDVRSKNPGWADCQPSGICRLDFSFQGKENGKDTNYLLVISGMEKYNFFVEAMRPVGSGKTVVKGLWFLGKLPGVTKVQGFVIGDSIRTINTLEGKEYSGFASVGWKQGIIEGKTIVTILRG